MLAIAGTALVWVSSGRLETASRRVAGQHGIPEVVRGAVVTAVASSFPEVSSVVVATLVHGDFELGLAAIVGSAIFNILVIPALAALASRRLQVSVAVVYRDALFYMVAVVTLLATFALAVIYHPTGGGASLQGELSRGLATLPLALYAVYLFIQYQDARDADESDRRGGRATGVAREWLVLAGSMLLVAGGVELLLRSAIDLGQLLGTPTFLWGLTVVAVGTSLPDAVISIESARDGKDAASLSNVLGSNTFDLLVAVPLGVVLGGATAIDFTRAAPMMGCLALGAVAVFVFLRRGLGVGRSEAIAMLGLYGAFVAWMALESFRVVSVIDALP